MLNLNLLDVLKEMKICSSLEEAINVICDKKVEVSNQIVDRHWYKLKDGFYRMRIVDYGNYKLLIKKGKLKQLFKF